MAQIDRLNLHLVSPSRAEIIGSQFRGSWFDLMMHAVGISDSYVEWKHEHINQLENQHHSCMAIVNEGGATQLALFMDELVQMMQSDMVRHTLTGCYATDFEYRVTDRSLPFDMNPVTRHGWRLVLPNVCTAAITDEELALEQLPMNGEQYACC